MENDWWYRIFMYLTSVWTWHIINEFSFGSIISIFSSPHCGHMCCGIDSSWCVLLLNVATSQTHSVGGLFDRFHRRFDRPICRLQVCRSNRPAIETHWIYTTITLLLHTGRRWSSSTSGRQSSLRKSPSVNIERKSAVANYSAKLVRGERKGKRSVTARTVKRGKHMVYIHKILS